MSPPPGPAAAVDMVLPLAAASSPPPYALQIGLWSRHPKRLPEALLASCPTFDPCERRGGGCLASHIDRLDGATGIPGAHTCCPVALCAACCPMHFPSPPTPFRCPMRFLCPYGDRGLRTRPTSSAMAIVVGCVAWTREVAAHRGQRRSQYRSRLWPSWTVLWSPPGTERSQEPS